MVVVRTARASDADAVLSLTAQLGYDVERSGLQARLGSTLAKPDHVVLIAEDAGHAIAWLHASVWEYLEADRFVVVVGLVVDKTRRRQGIGRMLMAHAEEWARARRCSIVRLWSSVERATAHEFYERLGYSRIKTQYAFAKSVDADRDDDLTRFVPRLDAETL
jgi:GNAT superfamily N-acetyltransferase